MLPGFGKSKDDAPTVNGAVNVCKLKPEAIEPIFFPSTNKLMLLPSFTAAI